MSEGARGTEARDPSLRTYELERAVAFSDGVIAVAITLLVVGLDVPNLTSGQTLVSALLAQQSQWLSYGISFLMIALFWFRHHRFCGFLRRVDRRWMVLNMIFLGSITVTSYATELYSVHSGAKVALAVYASVLAAMSLSLSALWAHSARSNLLCATHPHTRSAEIAGLLRVIVFLGAIPAACWLTPEYAPFVWFLSGLSEPAGRRLDRLLSGGHG